MSIERLASDYNETLRAEREDLQLGPEEQTEYASQLYEMLSAFEGITEDNELYTDTQRGHGTYTVYKGVDLGKYRIDDEESSLVAYPVIRFKDTYRTTYSIEVKTPRPPEEVKSFPTKGPISDFCYRSSLVGKFSYSKSELPSRSGIDRLIEMNQIIAEVKAKMSEPVRID